MEWSQEGTIVLIDAYKKKELIWCPKHPLHFNKFKKHDAWEEIAQEISKPVDECKKKMEGLLSSFRRENMKIRKSIGTGKGEDELYKSSWYAYESMRFIMDKNKPRQTLDTIQKESNEDDVDGELLNHTQESIIFQDSPVTTQLPSKTAPRKRKKPEEDPRLDSAFTLLSSCVANTAVNDGAQHFGNLVASKLRNYNEATQCAIQSDIFGIFLNANRGYYNVNVVPQHDSSSSNSSTTPMPRPSSSISPLHINFVEEDSIQDSM